MTRLTVLYHDDTREPIAVERLSSRGPLSTAAMQMTITGVQTGEAYCAGPDGEACRELLLRERRHWEETCKR